MTDIVGRLRDADTTRRNGESYADVHDRRQADRNEAADLITALRAEVEKLKAIVTPKPLDGTEPRDRVLIGVERPPFEDKTYYDIIHWREDQQDWMVEAGCDWSINPAPRLWAHWSASHYLDPLELPGLPYWDGKDDDEEDDT